MPSREFAEKLVACMKENRSKTLKQKCKELGMTAQMYYIICKKHGIDGRIGAKTAVIDEEKTLKLMNNFSQKITGSLEDSGTLKCTPSQGDSQ